MMNHNSKDRGVNQTSAKCLQLSFFSAAAWFFLLFLEFFRTLKQDVIVTRDDVKQDNEWKNEEVDYHEDNNQQRSPVIGTRVPFKVIAIQLTPKVFLIKRMTYEGFLVVPKCEVPVFLRITSFSDHINAIPPHVCLGYDLLWVFLPLI